MKSQKFSNKGFLFTAGMVFMALVILGAAFILFQSNLQRERETRLPIYDRMDNEVRYVENGFRSIVLNALTIEINGNNVTITEDLPNSKGNVFNTNVDRFKKFVENRSDFHLNLSVNEIKNTLPLFVNGVKYYHPLGFGNSQIVVSNASVVSRYDLYMTTSLTNIKCVWTNRNDAEDGVNFSVTTVPAGTCSGAYTLERDEASNLKINSTEANIYVTIGDSADPGKLLIKYDPGKGVQTNITVKSKMTLNTNNMLTVSFPEQSINITALEYNISRVGAIRIA